MVFQQSFFRAQKKRMKHTKFVWVEKRRKIQKKLFLSPQVFVCFRVFVVSHKTNPIKSSFFNLFRVLSLSLCASLSNNNDRFLFSKGSIEGVLFCSAKSFVTVFTAGILFSRRRRESARYIAHTQKTRYTNVATTDDERRTISKSKVGTVLRAL